MRCLSICSGIEAFSVAAQPLGWTTAAVAEIEPFPSRLLAYRFPQVPNLGDFTAIDVQTLGPLRFFLSAKAARGILRRAGNRGKELPPQLAHALKAVAASEQTSTSMED